MSEFEQVDTEREELERRQQEAVRQAERLYTWAKASGSEDMQVRTFQGLQLARLGQRMLSIERRLAELECRDSDNLTEDVAELRKQLADLANGHGPARSPSPAQE